MHAPNAKDLEVRGSLSIYQGTHLDLSLCKPKLKVLWGFLFFEN
jgi:hypothetical protein